MKSKKNQKRWKHGSSSSNPRVTKFRSAAKTGFFKPSGPSSLTVEALHVHDQDDIAKASQMDTDAQSESKTFNTWATNFTQCSNSTFNGVHKLWNSNQAKHKEVLALLASLTEVIKERSGKEDQTDLEYFAALMTYLDSVDSEESAAAAATLLGLVARKVPASALKAHFADISKKLIGYISKYSNYTSLLKSLLMSLACVLKVQDAACWNVSSTNNMYKTLLHFTVDRKPKIRKTAQEAVQMVLKRSPFLFLPDPPLHHPAAVPTAEFCITCVGQCGKQGVAEMDALHVLNLLQDVMVTFPCREIQMCCETLLKLMFINKPVVKSNGMAALYGLFSHHPSAASLPADLNAQIINALYDHQPAENDSGTMPAWLAVMEQAHLNLSRLNATLCLEHLPRLLATAMKCLLSHHKDVRTSAVKLTTLLLKECIGSESQMLADKMKGVKANGPETPLHKVVRALEAGLSYQYNSCWDLVFQLLATMVEVLGKICPDLLKKCLASMADLRDSVTFSYKADVDLVMGKAVKSMGPREILDAVALNITGTEDNLDLSRSWLLPVIRDNVSDTELSFFTTFFLPLATRFSRKAKELAQRGQQVVSKTYMTLETQVWSMLKGFCTRPTDLAKSFKGLARVLGTILAQRPDLQMDIMASLRTLINFSRNCEADRVTMSFFAKNYLPILFNLFTANPDNPRDSRRLAVLETIKVYLTITDTELLFSIADMCTEKMAEEDIPAFRKIALTDLAIVMVKYVDKSRLDMFYILVKEYVQASDKTLQKKAFRILEEICMCQSDTSKEFLLSNITQLQQLLVESLSVSAPNTRTPRLRCLTFIFHRMDEPSTTFVQAVVPEAILCTRGVGERVRAAAFQLIIEIAEAMMRWNPDTEQQDILSAYVNVLVAGLSGSPEMICGTLLALTRIAYHYKEKLNSQTLASILEVSCLLMASERREVVKSSMEFISMIIGAFSRDILSEHLSEMVNALSSIKSTAKHSCHMKTKQIFRKLLKKFGFEAVLKLTPEKMRVVVNKARSELQQQLKKKEKKGKQDEEDEDSDTELVKQKPETVEEILQFSDMEEEDEGKQNRTHKVQERKILIREEEEDVVDILDKSAAKKVIAIKSKLKAEKTDREETDGGFKKAPDGRLIITDPDEKQGDRRASDDEEDLDDLLTAIEGGSEKKRRKRLHEASMHEDEDEPQKKYKPGGTGIHRPLQTKDHGSEYKAKKAGGDMKKPGKLDPYSYVPLNFNTLNKRKQAKLKGQFAGLVKGARKGTLKAKRKGKKH